MAVNPDKTYINCSKVSIIDEVSSRVCVEAYVFETKDGKKTEIKTPIYGTFRREFIEGNRLEIIVKGRSFNNNRAWVEVKDNSGSFDYSDRGFWVDLNGIFPR